MPHDSCWGSWLDSPTTLGVATALGTLLAAIVAAWGLLVAGPRYRLGYGPMKGRQRTEGSWEVVLYLSGRGRRDITRKAFDGAQSVILDIGVPIRELTEAVSWPPATRVVPYQFEGTCLLVGPGLISRRQDLRFTVIAQTPTAPTALICQASLIDVRVHWQWFAPLLRAQIILGVFTAAYVLALIVAGFLLVDQGVGLNFVILVVTAFVGYGVFSWWLHRRYPGPLLR